MAPSQTASPADTTDQTPQAEVAVPLSGLGVLAARGPEARKFLNGQLSQDVSTLDPRQVRLAGLHTPQGRVTALLRLVARADDTTGTEVLCVLPRALLADTEVLLRRYLLRTKATLHDVSAEWRVEGIHGAPGRGIDSLGTAEQHAGVITWRHAPDGRCLRLRPISPGAAVPAPAPTAAQEAWHLADIASGLPQVHPTTRGAFVAQMLNLDVLGGISFTKGCYTGQEVIARAHYRGRVKRRLQRFEATPPTPDAALPEPGTALRFADGRGAQWVEGALRPDGRWEFLAVAPTVIEAAAEPAAGDGSVLRLEAAPLPLPYPLPD